MEQQTKENYENVVQFSGKARPGSEKEKGGNIDNNATIEKDTRNIINRAHIISAFKNQWMIDHRPRRIASSSPNLC